MKWVKWVAEGGYTNNWASGVTPIIEDDNGKRIKTPVETVCIVCLF
jgi:hypothetical protein